ncbi:hypothetical protein LVY72_05040 [Arthrobacter sp. I2-34]|uniref:Uncharacterized protein n=1 Tax=Arthrobacter hankyongi TaxID=2904801 RepID=A0ABS9L454_9MICC|nr:hypothetical protein [Arthrobacter hankyongi]MCG2621277.1 hypothetical protein [Arthrobacter hankyongi]
MEFIGLLTFLVLIALTAYTVHIARAGDGEPFIGPRPPRHRGDSRFLRTPLHHR